ncbi:PCI domain-containing protein 2 [Myotis brandtii]|uniref:PCI domain-containing protein 2 n=1 Tax=Myotis brandtii TaxID=109478 RepID=S7MDP3_MYOBR|nr:PCI domain-containing protein 2 [Myotis brandtii]
MFAAHLRCTYAVGNHDFTEAYTCQTVIVQSFLRAFQAHKEEKWALPVMSAVALDLRVFASNADQQLVKKGKSKVGDMLEKAAELLMSCFRVCASDTHAGREDSKKRGMLFLFAEVTRAVSEGYLLLLNEALAKHETFFIRCGIFLILEKLKIITYRNLFKKAYLLLKTNQLPLDAFLVALKFMQVEDVDIDEVQCILANLIYMVRELLGSGYISHQHQKLVVSKQNPFPPLSTVC